MADNIPQSPDVPAVATQPVPTPLDATRTSPETYGAGAGQQLQNAGDLANMIATDARNRANTAAVLDARASADNALNQQILSDQSGFRSLRGHDAMAGADKAVDGFDKAITEIGTGLKNDQQKRAFAVYALSLKNEAFRHVQGHLAQQSNIVEADSYKAAEAALIAKLGALPVAMNPAERDRQMLAVQQSATARALQVFGRTATPEEIANFAIPARQRALAQSLDTLLAHETFPGALAEAKKIIEDPKTEQLLGGEHTALVKGRIYRRANEQDGLRTAQAVAQFNLVPGSTVIAEKADEDLQAARDKLSPEAFKIADDRLQSLKVHGRQMQKQRDEGAFVGGVTSVGKSDDAGFQKAVDALSASPEGGQLLKSLYEFRSTTARRDAASPEAIRAYAQAFNNANDILASSRASDFPTSDSFLAQRLPDGRTIADTLSPGGLAKIGTEFQKKKEKEAADKPLDSHAMGLVKSTLVEALDYPTGSGVSPSDDQIAERNHVVDYVRGKRNAWKEANPAKEPADEQYQEWINEQVGVVKGSALPGFWNWSDRRRVDIEIQQGKAAPAPQPAAASVAPAPTAPQVPIAPLVPPPTEQDKTALDWLQKNPTGPAADKVRAKLKAKGLVP